jgi:hypothetical protein
MIASRHRAPKAVAAFLVFAIVQLYAQASLTGTTAYAQDASLRAVQGSGLLTTTGNRKIQVDKHDASTGATILDGMTLETPDCVAATVRWGGTQDEVSLGTNAIAIVNQSKAKVTVSLKQGCAIVRGGEYEDLTIETPDGQVMTATQFDVQARKSGQVCYPSNVRSEFSPTCLGAAPPTPVALGAGSTTAGVVAGAIGEIALIVVAVLNTRGENPSPITP